MLRKAIFAMTLIGISATANAVSLFLVSHHQTSGSGAIGTLITDGSHTSGIAAASTALWNWDGTTLTSTGLYSNVSSISSSPFTSTILSDQIVNLSYSSATGTASATAYSCIEGTFLATVGASGCGGYLFGGTNWVDESTTTWGPGTAVSQTIGGDDVLTGTARSISAYDFDYFHFDDDDPYFNGTYGLVIGNGIALGSAGGEWMCFGITNPDPEIGTLFPNCGNGIMLAKQVVPVPAAVWLFGSALGLAGWMRRKAS